MTKLADAWMPLYIGDYLADTSRLTTEGHGAYFLLLMDYWRNGPLPDDDVALAAVTKLPPAKWRAMRTHLVGFFSVSGGYWHQKRADEERQKAAAISGTRSQTGKRGAEARWGKQAGKQDGKQDGPGIAQALPGAWQTDAPSPSPRPEERKEDTPIAPKGAESVIAEQPDLQPEPEPAKLRRRKTGLTGEELAEFESWYEQYPLHVGRGQAENAYVSARRRPGVEAADLLSGAMRFGAECAAKGTDPRYIPHPATWLNGQRWRDETPKPNGAHGHAQSHGGGAKPSPHQTLFAAGLEVARRLGNRGDVPGGEGAVLDAAPGIDDPGGDGR